MLLLRVLARLVGIIWMVALALLGLGLALYCVDAVINLGSARPDRLIGLSSIRGHLGHFVDQLAASGPTAGLALLCAIGAMLLGVLLLIGLLAPRKQRLAVLERDTNHGTLAATPRTLRTMSRALAEQTPGATGVTRPRLALSRRGNHGRLKVTASRASTGDPSQG